MAINNPVLFGLKVSSNFADIESKSTALNNLGLDIRDLQTIEGISPTLSRTELQQVSGLDVNLTKYIDRLKSDTSQYSNLISLSSANIDTQGESILRPGGRQTTLYINNETKYFDLEDVFGFDRKVLTPDVVNTEAMFIVGRAIGSTAVDIDINITYVEQL